jgi:predicted permease
MSWLRSAFSRAADPFLRRPRDPRLDEELRAHLEMLADDFARSGMTVEEARRRARLHLGGIEQTKESARDQQAWPLIDHLLQDLRHAVRMVRRAPAFTLLAALTLALAIGANTAIFSVLDAVRLRSLPVDHPERLIQIISVRERSWQTNIDYQAFAHLRRTYRSLAGICAYAPTSGNVRLDGGADTVAVQAVSGNYFALLGFGSGAGRTLTDRDDTPGAAPVAVVSDHFWNTRLGRDPGAVGRTIFVDALPFAVVGIMRPDFFGADLASPPDIVVPLATMRGIARYSVQIMARTYPRTQIADVRAELQPAFREYLAQLAPGLTQATPRDRRDILSQRIDARPAANGMGDLRLGFTEPLLVLIALSGLVLLAGCANLSGLLLARSSTRTREFSVRLSLGASRGRLLAQLLVEASLLAAIGGGAALIVARWTQQALLSLFASDTAAFTMPYRIDLRILGFTFAVTVLSALLVGIVPAIRAARSDLYLAMRGAQTSAGRSGRPRTLERILLVQLAVSMVLIVGAGLFVRTLHNLSGVDPGFERDAVLLVDIDVRQGESNLGLEHLETQILTRVGALAGVRSAALASNEMFGGGLWTKTIWVRDRRYAPDEDQGCRFNLTSPGFFKTAGIPLLLGRDFNDGDRHGAPPVAVINEAMAHRYFPGENPIGRRFGDQGQGSTGKYEIVGVVANAKARSLREDTPPTVYQPLAQTEEKVSDLVLHVHTTADPVAVAPRIRETLHSVDRNLAVALITTLADRIDATLRRERLMALLGTAFATIALLLVCVGLYGAASGEVARRAREIGVRMALGARRSDIAVRVIGDTLVLAVEGLAIGLPASLAASRLVRGILFGIAASDAPTMTGASLLVTAVAVLAAVLPATRAASIDPMSVLRHE